MSTITAPMNRELALHTIIDAYKKGCDFTTLEIIAGGVLDKFAQYQWSLPAQDGDTSDDSSSIKAEASSSKTKTKKAKKPRAPPAPLDLAGFRTKFTEDATTIKKSDLVKAIGKNGFGIGHLCPDAQADADGKKKGNKIVCMTSEALRAVLTQYFATVPAPFETTASAEDSDSDSEDEEPKVEEQPIAQTGTHTRFEGGDDEP